MKRCPKCKQDRHDNEFTVTPLKTYVTCDACREKSRISWKPKPKPAIDRAEYLGKNPENVMLLRKPLNVIAKEKSCTED